jgi:hypothetical protein
MPSILEDLELEELSLVDVPANQEAKVCLFKRNTEEDMEDTEKMTPEMDAKIKAYMKEKGCDRETAMDALMKAFDEAATLSTEVETFKAENERLRKGLIEAGYVIKKDEIVKKEQPEGITYKGEFIAKSDDKYELAKQLQEYEVEKAQVALEKRATEELPNHDVKVAVTLLKALDTVEDKDEAMKALKAADAMLGKAMEETGETSHENDLTDPADKLEKMAKAYANKEGVTFHKGYEAVIKTDEGKALLKASKEKE